MSDLIVLAFQEQEKAEAVLNDLQRMEAEHLIDLEDAAIIRHQKNGKVKLKQTYNLIASGAMGGSFWGLLIGLLFMSPIVGILTGSVAGAATGALSDIGIDDAFMKDLGQSLKPDTSALFVLVRKITPDKVMAELHKYAGEGTVLRTSLSIADEEKLREVLTAKKQDVMAQAGTDVEDPSQYTQTSSM